jgi:hypothetical protein
VGSGGATSGGPDSSGGGGAGGSAAGGAGGGGDPGPGWSLKWSGDATVEGMAALEGADTADCTHPGVQHVGIVDANYRVEMHVPEDVDCGHSDRQRNELKGMGLVGGGRVDMTKGSRWLLTYWMFIPSTLHATKSFTHIHQEFGAIGTSATTNGPFLTMSLQLQGSTPTIEVRLLPEAGGVVDWSPIPLAPLQDKWVKVELEALWDDNGSLRWTIRDDTKTYVDVSRPFDTWRPNMDRVRPKFGIYRSLASTNLETTYILFNHFRGYVAQ